MKKEKLIVDIKLYSVDKVFELTKSKEQLCTCSDGGAVNTVGSFGSIIMSTVEILIEITGQDFVHTP